MHISVARKVAYLDGKRNRDKDQESTLGMQIAQVVSIIGGAKSRGVAWHTREVALMGSPTIDPIVGRPLRKQLCQPLHQLLPCALPGDQLILEGAACQRED
jgi:hypothetical protein